MKTQTKIALYSVLAIVLFTAFFYFYDAAIFEANITEDGKVIVADISLKAFMDHELLPNTFYLPRVTDVAPSWKGWMLIIICCLGLPIMIGYRVATNGNKKK